MANGFHLTNIKNKKDINFCLYKNKELVQQGNSNHMILSFDKIVAYISNYFSVNIGDLIFTGTPAGVGEVVVGDELEGFMKTTAHVCAEVEISRIKDSNIPLRNTQYQLLSWVVSKVRYNHLILSEPVYLTFV